MAKLRRTQLYIVDLVGNGYFKARKIGQEGDFGVFEIIEKQGEAKETLRGLPDEFFNFGEYEGNQDLQVMLGKAFIGPKVKKTR